MKQIPPLPSPSFCVLGVDLAHRAYLREEIVDEANLTLSKKKKKKIVELRHFSAFFFFFFCIDEGVLGLF